MKTTKTHFKIFKEEFLKWQKKLGLSDWRVDFQHVCEDGASAATYFHYLERVVNVGLTSDWGEDIYPLTEENIRSSAKHEALHLLGADMYILANSRYATKDEIHTAAEGQVRRLERVL